MEFATFFWIMMAIMLIGAMALGSLYCDCNKNDPTIEGLNEPEEHWEDSLNKEILECLKQNNELMREVIKLVKEDKTNKV